MIEPPLLYIDRVSPQYFLSLLPPHRDDDRHPEPPPSKMSNSSSSSSLSTVEAKLPPGFRFHPRDDELICDYLLKWISTTGSCSPQQFPLLIEVDLNKCEPWDIPETACVGGKEWYFYSQRDRKYATGQRTNRATVSGYWKATGKDRAVTRKGALVGMRKTLVFYQGRAPKGRKTDWVMHEFRLDGTLGPGPRSGCPVKEDWVLCRVFYKSRSEVPNKLLLQDNHHLQKAISCSSHQVITTAPASPPPVLVMSLPRLMEPYNDINTIYDHQIGTHHHQAIAANHDHHHNHNIHHEQVPCFSIFSTTSQTSPNFSLVTTNSIMDPLLQPNKTMPSCFGGMLPAAQHEDHHHHQLGINYNTSSSLSHDQPPSSTLISNYNNNVNLSYCDKKLSSDWSCFEPPHQDGNQWNNQLWGGESGQLSV